MAALTAVTIVGAAVCIAGCTPGTDAPKAAAAEAANAATVAAAASDTAAAGADIADARAARMAPAVEAPDARPAFAAIYPGGVVEGDPLNVDGAAGRGGLVTFTTSADPAQVVAFYRERAEAAGLQSVTSMNQGEARAYGAAAQKPGAAPSPTGASVQVVASPSGDGATSVQLTWSGGA